MREMTFVNAIREAIGPHLDLAIDLHGRYDGSAGMKLAHELEPFNLLWLEEPVPPENVDAMRRIKESTRTPICAGENLYLRYGFRDLLEKQAVDIIMPDISKCGGLSECRKIAHLADAYNTPWAAHVSMGSPIHIAASLHLAAATPNFLICECPTHDNPIGNNLLVEPLVCRDGAFALPTGPGLGIELDPEALDAVTLGPE